MTAYREMPRLDRSLAMRGFGHPTWFVIIVKRIARRRFVSWEEIEGRILDWYCAKHGYYSGYVRQHGIHKQLNRYRRWSAGGIVGMRDYTGVFTPPNGRRLICVLDERGQRVDSQHCSVCGKGINPVWGGKPKRRLTCRHPVCHEIDRWWWRKTRAGDGWRLWQAVHADLRPLALLWWYLDWLLKQERRDARKAKRVRENQRRAA